MPNINLQSRSHASATIGAKLKPTVHAMVLMPTMVPRILLGDTSARYTGTIYDATPTPSPVINLPNINSPTVLDTDINIDPTLKSKL